MNNKNILAFACFLLFGLLVVPALATTYWTLNVYVYDTGMSPVTAEYIKVIDSTGSIVQSRSNSQTLFVTLPQGVYNISVYNRSYNPSITTLNVNRPYPSYNVTLTRDTLAPTVTGVYAYKDSAGASIAASTWQTDNSPYFNWTTSETTESYNYTVDAAAYTTTSNAYVQYPNNAITNGQRVFKVKAKDMAGNWGIDTTFNIWVDNSTPNIMGITAFTDSGKTVSIKNDTWQTDNSPYFNWTDPASLSDDTFYYTQDGTDPTITSPNTANAFLQASGYTEGSTTFIVKAKNGAGTWGSKALFVVKYDGTAPTVTVIGAPGDWQSASADANIGCTDSKSGCNMSTFALNISSTASCPSNYADYTITALPHTVSQHAWVCAAAKDNAGNVGFSAPTEFKIDKIGPQWSNNKTAPISPTDYVKGASYQFNITWTDDTGIDQVEFVFDGTTYTSEIQNTGNEYYITLTDLKANPAGYTYYWTANDTVGNTISTPAWNYIINKADPMLALTFDPIGPATYGTPMKASCTAASTEIMPVLYRNISGTPTDVTTDENDKYVVLPAGAWGYVCNITETENYSTSTGVDEYTVLKADPSAFMNLTIEPSTAVDYGVETNATAWATATGAADMAYTLYRDATTIGDGNPISDVQTLDVGTYNYVYNTSGGENWTAGSVIGSLTVGPATNPISLWLNGNVDQNLTITYGTAINATATAVAGPITLLRDGFDVTVAEMNQLVTLAANPAGYAYKASTAGDANHPANETDTYYLIVEKAASTCDLTVTPASVIYPAPVTATCGCSNPETTATLFRDGANADAENGIATVLTVGMHDYVCNASETANYTEATNSTSVTVDKATTTDAVIHIDFDGATDANRTYTYEDISNATAWKEMSEGALKFYRDGALISGTEDIQQLGAGTYNYTVEYEETENYSAATKTFWLTVNKKSINIYLELNGAQADYVGTYPDALNATASKDATLNDEGTLTLFENESDVGGLSKVWQPAAGAYGYKVNFTADNYTATDVMWTASIAKAVPTNWYTLDPASPVTVGTNTTFTCGFSNTDAGAIVKMWYHDNLGGPWMELLNDTPTEYPVGEWFHYCNVTETENFTTTYTYSNVPYVVTQIAPTLTLLLNGTDGNYTIESGVEIPLDADLSVGGKTLRIIVDGTEMANGTAPLGMNYSSTVLGEHNITAVFDGDTNYAAASATHWLTVQDMTAPVITILSPINDTYGSNHIALEWTANEPVTWAGYNIDGGANTTLTGNSTIPAVVGTHTLYMFASDSAGNMGTAEVTFSVVDVTPPVINKIWNTTPVYAGLPANFSINATDNVAIANITVNGTLATWLSGDVWMTIIDVPAADGIYRWPVIATDLAGNTAFRRISMLVNNSSDPNVTVDTEPPTVGPISPLNATAGAPVNLSAYVSDDTMVANCTLFVANASAGTMSGSLPSNGTTVQKTFVFDSAGNYTAYASCYDIFDNEANGTAVTIVVNASNIIRDTGGSGGPGPPPIRFVPSLTISVQSPIVIDAGTTGVYMVNVHLIDGTGLTNVTLSINGMPYTFTVEPQMAAMGSDGTQIFTVNMPVPADATSGVYKIGVLASSAEGLSANAAADLIIKKPWERVEEVIGNVTKPVQNITTPVEKPPAGPTGLVGALTTVNPFAWLGILLAVMGILGWLWYKKPELFKRKKKDTNGGKQAEKQ